MRKRQQGKKGNKRQTHGRKRRQCERYRLRRTRERNKARRLRRHLARHPNDRVARAALQGL